VAVASTSAALDKPSGGTRDWESIGIGAGVGTAVPLLALIAIGVLLWRRHRRRRRRRETYKLPPTNNYPDDGGSAPITKASMHSSIPASLKSHEADGRQIYELDSVAERVQLPLKNPRELPGSEGERQRYQAYQSTVSYGYPYRPG
jgi:hypothetical protein